MSAEASGERAAPGVLLGERFRLERVIGAGGMASVWLGRDEQLGRPVAVKMISDALADDEMFVERFAREARTAAGVTHPNLVSIFDFDASGTRPYLVMEYVDGPTLAVVIETELERLDPERVARELLGALRRIHEAGIIHRDVKPHNILVGEDGRLRLTDFGIARPEDATSLTTTGQVLGTLRYLAPEVQVGEPASERSDLYSAGIVLRECLPAGEIAALAGLAARMSDPDPEKRPSSAEVALSEIDDTGRLAGTPPPPPISLPPAEESRTRILPEEPIYQPPPPLPSPPPAPASPPTPWRPHVTTRARLARLRPVHVLVAAIVVIAGLLAAVVSLDDDRGRPLIAPREVGRIAGDDANERPLIPIS
ncbi:MAG: serine/threonine-protein kinase [Solirubrobacterales bacterium]